jgi:hypothetical protein
MISFRYDWSCQEKVPNLHDIVRNVDFKDNPDRNKRNILLEFDTDSTWMEVLEDTLEEGNVDVGIRKTYTVTVNLTS